LRDKVRAMGRQVDLAVKELGWGAFPLRALGQAQGTVAEALAGADSENAQMVLARVMQAREESPDGALLFLEIELRYLRALRKLRSRPDEFRSELRQVAELQEQLPACPTLAPRAALLYRARCLAIIADLSQLRAAAVLPAKGQIARLRANLDRIVSEGRSWPDDRSRRLENISRLLLLDPTTTAERQKWPGTRLQERQQLFLDLGRRLLGDWRQADPASAPRAHCQAQLNQWAQRIDQSEQ
jgi:hypothetical protein